MKKSVYRRPNKPKTLTVTQRNGAPSRALPALPDVLSVDRTTECHVTPADVALRMVEALEASRDQLTLEPSAGNGSLVNALLESDHSPFELVMVERSSELCGALRNRFSKFNTPDPINECFLDYAERASNSIEYPRIIMNSPFKAVKKHVEAALNLLGRAGHRDAAMVALVPVTFEHVDAELIELLPNDTFASAAVYTKIVRFVR